MITPFGSYEPDQPPTVSGITRTANGVVAVSDNNLGVSYGPYPAFTTTLGSTALAGDPRGTITLVDSAGATRVFVGQETSIVEMDATWGPTTIDSGLTLTADDDWSFEHYGAYLIATNSTNGMWAYNVDSNSGAGNISGAPLARQVFKTNEVLIALDCDGFNRRWENCAMGDHTNWSTLEANYDDLEGGGALVGGRDMARGSALMFQDNAINILRFGQSTSLFTVTKLGMEVGSVGERSLVSYSGIVYGLHTQGFFATNGAETIWIGDNKIDETFLATINTSDMHLVQAAVDPFRKLIMWYYDGTIWAYNWSLNKWSTITQTLNALMRVATPGYNSDTADALGNVDTVGMPGPDSRFWQGGSKILGAFGTDNKIGFFTGDNYAATIDTSVHNSKGRGVFLEATPMTDDPAVTISLGTSERLQDTITYGDDIAVNEEGFCPIDGAGRNIIFREKHSSGATWTNSRGVNHPKGYIGEFQ